jgi:uncharacterized coiled-coil protein SlyX
MDRNTGIGVGFAVVVVLSTLAAAPVATAAGTSADETRQNETAAGAASAPQQDTAGDPWRVTNDVTVYRNGTARVVLTTNGSVEAMQMTKRNVNGLEFHSGAAAVTEDPERVIWDLEVSDRLVYTVDLGNAKRYGSAVLDNAILFRTSEILSVKYWRPEGDVPAPERRIAIHAPEGWTEAAPGERVGPDAYELQPTTRQGTFVREMVAVGDFEVHTWTEGDDTVRYAAFPTAAAPPEGELEELLTASMPVLEEYTGTDPASPMLAMTVPASIENGGVARQHSFIVQGNSPPFDVENGHSTYVHEFTHLYQHNWGVDGSDWINEGMASYYQHLVLREAGLVTPGEFRNMVRVDTTAGWTEVGEPVSAAAGGARYKKGEAVYAALDVSVRADTNGDRHIGDVVARFNEQTADSERRYYVTTGEFLAALEAVTGESYRDFFGNYVESTMYPEVLLSEEYSLSDPVAADPGLPPAGVLAERNAELRDRVATQNETITSLRGRLAAKNETVASLRDDLDRREDRLGALRERLAAKNETIASLRARLPASSGVAGTTTTAPGATLDAAGADGSGGQRTSSGSGDLRVVGLLGGLGVVFALGVRVGRRE